jgi:iron complex outermembrane receptor protein
MLFAAMGHPAHAQAPEAALDSTTTQLAHAPPGGDEDLLMFGGMPVVFTAARRQQRMNELAVPVSVLTRDDIRYRGVRRIPDILLQIPGIDVLPLDRNRYTVGVRGLHHEYGDRTLVLINGRNANSPLVGGVDFMALPLLVDDLERIEVVRGPGGAVWGANAFNGVVNLITTRPEDRTGVALTTGINHFGDVDSYLRWSHRAGDLAWRLSTGYQEFESSEDAIINDRFTSRDFARTPRLDGEGVWFLDDSTRLRFGLAVAHLDRGDFGFAQRWPMLDERIDAVRAFARLEHEFDGGAGGYIQWFSHLTSENRPTLWRVDHAEHDLEAQLSLKPGERHSVILGGNVRYITLNQTVLHPEDIVLRGDPYSEAWIGAFITDRWQIAPRLALEGQFRIDNYTETTTDWSARAAALYSLDEEHRHVLRAAYGKAFRAPLAVIRDFVTFRRPLPSPPFPPGTFAVNALQPDPLDHEQIHSFEAGYTGRIGTGVDLRVNAYYQRLENLIGVRRLAPGPVFVVRLDNIDGGEAYGIESEIVWQVERARLYAWHAYNAFDPDRPSQDIRAYYPAEHKVGAGARVRLTNALTANADYRYSAHSDTGTFGSRADPAHRLDLALTFRPEGAPGEVQIGVIDVLRTTVDPVLQVGAFGAHETPGRTFFATARFEF